MPHLPAEVWRWIAIGSGVVTTSALVLFFVGTKRGVFFVGWDRYTDYLTRRLRQLHLFRPAAPIAAGQLSLTFIILLAASFGLCPYWYAVIGLVAIIPAVMLERRVTTRIKKLDVQADAFCLALANSLKSTASVGAAVETAAALVDNPTAQEMQLAVKETKLGRGLTEALEAVGPRARSRKLGIVLAAVLIGRQVGGDLPRVLDTTATTLREMERLEGVVRQKTAEGRMQMWALSLAPIVICAAIYKLDPTYFEPFSTTLIGQIALAIAMALYASGLVVARKVLRVDI
jgi:tight adherence protein B